MAVKDRVPAFPTAIAVSHGIVSRGPEGMELRDWFAGQALIGVMVLRAAIRDQGFEDINQESIAEEAYELADAMMAAREKEPEA